VPRLGETVPPGIVTQLARLGLWDPFLAAGHVPVPGVVALWGSRTPYENEFLVNPYGCGWHLDRAGFEAMLLGAAEGAGVEVHTGAVLDCRGDGPRGWVVRVATRDAAHGGPRSGAGVRALLAPWIIDASGRGARVARARGVEQVTHDRLIALARFFTVPDSAATRADTRTVIEAVESGWWYHAALPAGRAVAVLFTDADLLPPGALRRARWWDDHLAATRLVADRLDSASVASRLTAASAATRSLAVPCGPGWLAIGDAAQCWDPLSGQGVLKALASAAAAVEVLVTGRSVDCALDRYGERARSDLARCLVLRAAHYRRETRWADSPFWLRRAG
jgi:flavin-dependent dehydrogenase